MVHGLVCSVDYGCTWKVGRALKNLELFLAIASTYSYAFFVLCQLPACIYNSMEYAKP